MVSKVFLIGMIGGLAVAIGLAAVFSAIATQSTAQMMQHNSGMTGNQMMMGNPSMIGMQGPWQWSNKATFSANGMSTVENVQITGISISGNDEVTVNLRYLGNSTTPSVTAIAVTNPMAMMGMMHDGSGMGMMGDPMMTAPGMMWNNSLNTTTSIPFAAFQSHTGSSVLNAGWTSDTTLKVRLNGERSAYDSNGIHVMVFPLTS